VEVDLEKDTLDIAYDPKKVTPEDMLKAVDREGFQGKVVHSHPEQ
jgi:copper chaperone CopZ